MNTERGNEVRAIFDDDSDKFILIVEAGYSQIELTYNDLSDMKVFLSEEAYGRGLDNFL